MVINYYEIKKDKYQIFLEFNWEERYKIKNPFEDLVDKLSDEILGVDIKKLEDHEFKPKYSLENIVELSKLTKIDHINSKTKARVVYVSPNELPSGNGWKALGQYNPNTHTIYIANNLDPQTTAFVYYHEEAHAYGIMSERLADSYATTRTGYNLREGFNYEAHYGMAA